MAGVGEMEQDRAGGEDQQWPAGDQDTQAGRLLALDLCVAVQSARTVIVDGAPPGWRTQ
jgi:hypothetical protein